MVHKLGALNRIYFDMLDPPLRAIRWTRLGVRPGYLQCRDVGSAHLTARVAWVQ